MFSTSFSSIILDHLCISLTILVVIDKEFLGRNIVRQSKIESDFFTIISFLSYYHLLHGSASGTRRDNKCDAFTGRSFQDLKLFVLWFDYDFISFQNGRQ